MRTLCLSCIALAVSLAASAEDVKGSHDHPAVARYPGSEIQWYSMENDRPYKVPTGPATGYRLIGNWIKTEGRLTRIYYALEDGEHTHAEVWRHFMATLPAAGFEIIASGLKEKLDRGPEVGSRNWQEIVFAANPWKYDRHATNMLGDTATSGGSGSIVLKKERPEGTVYTVVSVYQFSAKNVSILVDVLETGSAQSGLIVADAESIESSLRDQGHAALDGILFEAGTANLKDESAAALEQVAAYLKKRSGKMFYVVGHTDSEGALEDNLRLSLERAQTVANALVKNYGIKAGRLECHGVGPLVPTVSNESDGGRTQNQRVELVER